MGMTSYIDANGEKKTGYIIDGRTYEDEAGTTPVGVGSVVDTDAGRYIKTDNGSMLYSDYLKNNGITETPTMDSVSGNIGTGYLQNGITYTDPLLRNRVGSGTVVRTDDGLYIKTDNGSKLYTDYLKQQDAANGNTERNYLQRQLDELENAYNSAVAANDSVYAAQIEQQRRQVQNRIAELNRGYEDLNRQLYRDYMMNQRDLPQQLAAQGITGGMTESSMIGLTSGYESDLARNERERLTGVKDLESGGDDAELQLAIAKAQADADAGDNRYSRLAAVLAAMQEQENLDRQYKASEEDRLYSRQLNEAQILAKMGDYSKLYSLIGAPAQTAAPPVYSTQPVKDKTETTGWKTGSQRGDAVLAVARINLAEHGEEGATNYLSQQLQKGTITGDEAEKIVAILNAG